MKNCSSRIFIVGDIVKQKNYVFKNWDVGTIVEINKFGGIKIIGKNFQAYTYAEYLELIPEEKDSDYEKLFI